MIRILLIGLFISILGFSCIKKSKVSVNPQISYIKTIFDTISIISGDSMNKFSIVSIGYVVQNGEISGNDSLGGNLVFKDASNGTSNFSFAVPAFKGRNTKYDAESGVIDVIIENTFIQKNGIAPILATYWNIQLTDKLGKKSNDVKVGPIFIKQ